MDNSFNSSLYFKDEKEMLHSIKNFLNRPDIKNCGDTISFYHLYKMVKAYMSIVNKKFLILAGGIPAIMVVIAGLIGNIIGVGTIGALNYILIILMLLILVLC